jgi:hypothetical protein
MVHGPPHKRTLRIPGPLGWPLLRRARVLACCVMFTVLALRRDRVGVSMTCRRGAGLGFAVRRAHFQECRFVRAWRSTVPPHAHTPAHEAFHFVGMFSALFVGAATCAPSLPCAGGRGRGGGCSLT